jgi:hypothetical protein
MTSITPVRILILTVAHGVELVQSADDVYLFPEYILDRPLCRFRLSDYILDWDFRIRG